MPTEQKTFFNLPVGIWLIGLVGFLMNLSTIIVFGVMPVFMSQELGATDATITTIDSIVEFLSHLCRTFSGTVGDILHNRKLVLGVGFSLATLVKPLFALAPSVGWIFFVRALDRTSNGIQASPRDALIADLAPPTHRGAAFGLGKSLKTIGSVVGAIIAYLILDATLNDFRLLFALATIPAALGLILFIFKVKEPKHRDHFQVKVSKTKKKFNWKVFSELRWSYWKIILISIIVQLPHFSESALTLRAKNSGLEISYIAFVMMIFNLGQFTIAYPLGRLSDRIKRHYILILGCFLMICAHLCLAFNINHYVLFTGVALWGAQVAITQSILVAMISDVTPQYIRGTAFGIFYVISGIVVVIATNIANYLSPLNSRYPFFNGAFISFIAILILVSVKFPRQPIASSPT
jgi:MFS family permease